MNLIVTDIVNGLIGILQATELHLLVNEIESSGFFKIILVLQALFIRTSLFTIVVLNLSRLVVIVAPFHYSEIFSINKTRIILLVIWISGIIECTVKYFTKIASTYTFYSSGVLFNIILNVAVLALAGLIIVCLKKSVDDCAVREKATKTVVIVSVIFFFSYGYYNYVYIVWMIPGLCETSNPVLQFTAIGKWSLSLAHLFLLISSIFNGIIFGMQPKIKSAIENIWVKDYRRKILQQSLLPLGN